VFEEKAARIPIFQKVAGELSRRVQIWKRDLKEMRLFV
jgi:hypothetical protein